jgi:hypothetical protein
VVITTDRTNTTIFRDDAARIVVNDSTNIENHTRLFRSLRNITPREGKYSFYSDLHARNDSIIEITNHDGGNPIFGHLLAMNGSGLFVKNTHNYQFEDRFFFGRTITAKNSSATVALDTVRDYNEISPFTF